MVVEGKLQETAHRSGAQCRACVARVSVLISSGASWMKCAINYTVQADEEVQPQPIPWPYHHQGDQGDFLLAQALQPAARHAPCINAYVQCNICLPQASQSSNDGNVPCINQKPFDPREDFEIPLQRSLIHQDYFCSAGTGTPPSAKQSPDKDMEGPTSVRRELPLKPWQGKTSLAWRWTSSRPNEVRAHAFRERSRKELSKNIPTYTRACIHAYRQTGSSCEWFKGRPQTVPVAQNSPLTTCALRSTRAIPFQPCARTLDFDRQALTHPVLCTNRHMKSHGEHWDTINSPEEAFAEGGSDPETEPMEVDFSGAAVLQNAQTSCKL